MHHKIYWIHMYTNGTPILPSIVCMPSTLMFTHDHSYSGRIAVLSDLKADAKVRSTSCVVIAFLQLN